MAINQPLPQQPAPAPQPGALQRFLSTAPVMFALITMIASGLAGFGAAQIRLAQYEWNDRQSIQDRADIRVTLKEHEQQIRTMRDDLIEIKTILRTIERSLRGKQDIEP